MFIFIGILILVFYFYIRQYLTESFSYFDKRKLKNNKPTLKGLITMQSKSFPELISLSYNSLKGEKISGIFEMTRPVYFINDPKIAKIIAIKDFDHFVDRRSFVDEDVDKLFGKSIVNMKGERWRDMRSTLSPFFTGSKMRQMYSHVAVVGDQTSKTIKEQIRSGGSNVVEFKEFAMKFTVDVIASAAFGIELNSFANPDNEFQDIARKSTNFSDWRLQLKFMGYIFLPKLMKAMKVGLFDKDVDIFFKKAVLDIMAHREEKNIVRNDMIHLLNQAKKGKLKFTEEKNENINEGFATVQESEVGKSEVKTKWSDEDLAAQAFIFFFGGFDTVATTMGFLAHELMINPDVQEKVYEEIKEMQEQLDGATISYEQIQGMKYLDQCVSEVMRKWTVAPATERVCVKDYEFDHDGMKFTIEKGNLINIPIHGYHTDPLFFPNPDKFDPERFSPENRHNIDPDTFLPFGLGPRNCIGSRFALMEVKTIFYYLIANFKLEPNEKSQIPLQLLKKPFGMKTEKGIWMSLTPRV